MMPMSSPVRALVVTTAAAVGLAIVPPSFPAPGEAFYVRWAESDRCRRGIDEHDEPRTRSGRRFRAGHGLAPRRWHRRGLAGVASPGLLAALVAVRSRRRKA